MAIRAVGKPWEAPPAVAMGEHGPPTLGSGVAGRDAGLHIRSAERVRNAARRPGQVVADGSDKTKVGGVAPDAEDEDA